LPAAVQSLADDPQRGVAQLDRDGLPGVAEADVLSKMVEICEVVVPDSTQVAELLPGQQRPWADAQIEAQLRPFTAATVRWTGNGNQSQQARSRECP
jgi:hypothetical protein